MSFLRQFSVICVHMHISEWYYARGVGLHFYAAVFTPPLSPAFFSPCSWPTLVFSFQPHQPRLLGAIASSPSPFFSWTSTSSSPCFSTYSCLSNGPHLAEIEGLQQTHSPSSGDNQAFPHSQITRGMNVCLYVSHDLSLSLSTGFLGHSPLCALHSPSLSAALPSSFWFILWRHCSGNESFEEGLKGAS